MTSCDTQGRDHGIPSYAHWREMCGLRRPRSFDDLDVDDGVRGRLRRLYR